MSSRIWPPLLQPVVAPARAHGFPAAPRPQSLIGSLGARAIRGRGLGGAGWGGRAAPGRERGLRGPAAWGLGPHGHPGAGPMATAEARGSAGPRGREAGVQEAGRRGARAGLPPGEGAHRSVRGQQGARVPGCPAQRPPALTTAQQRPGPARHGGFSGWRKEPGPALPEVHRRRVWTF